MGESISCLKESNPGTETFQCCDFIGARTVTNMSVDEQTYQGVKTMGQDWRIYLQLLRLILDLLLCLYWQVGWIIQCRTIHQG